MSELVTFIPAGGLGSRLSPHTTDIPKPLLVMGDGKRLIDHPLELADEVSARTWVSTDYLAERVEEYVAHRDNVFLLRDSETVGSGGSLVEHYSQIQSADAEGDLLILPSDHIYEGVSIDDMWQVHKESQADLTFLTVPNKPYGEYVEIEGDTPVAITTSPQEWTVSTTGIFMLRNKYILDSVRKARQESQICLNIYRDIICPALGSIVTAQYFVDEEQGFWEDAGTVSRYLDSNMRLSDGASVIAENAIVAPDAVLEKCVVQGKRVEIEGGTKLTRAVVTGLDNGELLVTQL